MNIYLLNATLNGKLLSEILCARMPVKGIITLNDDGDNKTPEYHDYSEFCREREINCIKLKSYNMSDESDQKQLGQLDIDLIIVASWQRLIPSWFIRQCSIGIIGAHGSHEGITMGRGRSPQNWALMMGKTQFSLSIFWIEEGTDNGAVIDTREFEYMDTDNILTSYVKINLYKADMILKNIENGRIARKEGTVQNEQGYYLPQRKREDGMIDWNRDAIAVNNMVRALAKPYPGAFTVCDDIEFIVWSSRPVVAEDVCYLYDSAANGTVVSILEDSALVKCGKNLLLIDSCTNYDRLKEGMVFQSADYRQQLQKIIHRHQQKYDTPLSRLVLDEV
ncbi:MAG: hypothetical protein K2I96_16765 [Lachnospiraceae bacterium]|nr:hypothetical protein [Lachnospiraceae bacterium]